MQLTASEPLTLGTAVGLLVWVPVETPMYNMGTPSDDVKGQNIWYHPQGKIPKPRVILAHGDRTATV